jgi:hypothetical protein
MARKKKVEEIADGAKVEKVDEVKPEVKAETEPKAKKKVKTERQKYNEFVNKTHKEFNENGDNFRKTHHPDMHSVGTSPQCKYCDKKQKSMKELYDEQ